MERATMNAFASPAGTPGAFDSCPSEAGAPENLVLVCSIGGSKEPIVKSINYHRPRQVIWVVSADSREKIEEIRKELVWDGIRLTETITLADYQDLLSTVRDIREGIEDFRRTSREPEKLVFLADITGGTKIMSAALTLAMMEFPSRFTYVGGGKRSKDGLGVVESGHEVVMPMDNPWDVMAYREARALVEAFNRSHFATARRVLDTLLDKKPEDRGFYETLRRIVEAYASWDKFDYKNAANTLRATLGRLAQYAHRSRPELRQQFKDFERSLSHLETVAAEAEALGRNKPGKTGDFGRAWLIDQLANARRRGDAGRYDDAVARLYSTIEKALKITLAKYGKNNSALTEDDMAGVSQAFREAYLAGRGENGVYKLPLQASAAYLRELDPDNPVAQTFAKKGKALKDVLDTRNNSLLAHGYQPVGEDAYKKLFSLALEFLGLDEADLPSFPLLRWNALLL